MFCTLGKLHHSEVYETYIQYLLHHSKIGSMATYFQNVMHKYHRNCCFVHTYLTSLTYQYVEIYLTK